jgi:hypothetical protein
MMLGFSARAGSISEEQARAKAQHFLQSRHPSPSGKRLARVETPTDLKRTSLGETALYVFNVGSNDGFVIVSGDDRTRSILGYADSGTFDATQMPAALREMLAIYARQIEMLEQSSAKPDSAAAKRMARATRRVSAEMNNVTPLLTTSWNQFGPYNDYCPTLDNQTALTGCVATAMAQIAYYYKYPKTQVPSLAAYTSATNKINVSAWGATTFDWNNMLDSYNDTETDTQKEAVATLMRYCGQAAQMDYGFTSGAYNGDALVGFTQKLGYNANASFKSASSYSANGWEDLIYREVSEGRPVYYSALNGDVGCDVSGHAFVIDGYKTDGNFFHVNWGWGGAGNGYFNLFALDPDAPESPVTTTGWHYQMLALIGLSPETVNTAKLLKDASGSWLITSADDWNELATNLEAYNGGTFKLTQDISVSTMVGTEDQPFSGTFDGQGHTLSVNIESDSWGAAPFSFIGAETTIKLLKTTGTVNCSAYHASGLIGSSPGDWNFGVSVVGCEVAVTVNGSDYAGGFIGHARCMQPVFTDCVFSGSINGCHNHACFVGWKEYESRPVYVNCLSVPTSFNRDSSYDFSHPGNGGSTDHATLTNCYSYFANGFRLAQGTAATAPEMADGTVAHGLQSGQREWTDGQVWGQQIGTDAVPTLTADAAKGVHQVTFILGEDTATETVLKKLYTNGAIGDKMPAGEDFGLTNATFTSNNTPFTASTPVSHDLTVSVSGTWAFTQTLGTPEGGSLSVNNTSCMPGTLKKITVAPASGYVVSAVTVTAANGQAVPVTPVSNNAHEFVFVFPKSSATVTAEFTAGKPETARFINSGMTLPLWADQPWTADTWTIWSNEYQTTLGTPPADTFGHQWYEESYMLTNSDSDVQPNGNKIIWENHTTPFGNGRNYDYARACGATSDGPNNFYMRRIFTFNTATVPEKFYLRCNYDDAPVKIYLNGTLIYNNNNQNADSYTAELTPAQIALIHTDGTPNVLAARGSQGGGDYYLDCGLYDPTALSYEVTDGQTLRVMRNEFLTGDIVVPQTVDYGGTTYTVTSVADDAVRDLPYITSMSLPSTVGSLPTDAFRGCGQLKYVKSHFAVYQVRDGVKTLIAAPLGATTFVVDDDCSRIFDNAFKFTSQLQTLTLPRPLTTIGANAFVGCTALTAITCYARPVPQTQGNAFDGLDKSGVTVNVYASALEGYQQSWGEGFRYVTTTDPQPLTLTIAVPAAGTLGTLIAEAAAQQGATVYDVVGINVTGSISQADLRTLADMSTSVYSLATIDLSGAVIEGNYIGESMFRNREKLTAITLPTTLTHIRSNAFTGCSQLQTVAGLEGLSDSNIYNSWDVFRGTAITTPVYGGSVFLYLPPAITGSYDMPAGIQQITAGALRDSKLSSITLPASLTTIGDDAFQDNPNLTDIYCYATTPPTCVSGVWEHGFDRSACTVHVPAAAVDDYKSANEWKDMGRIVAMVAPGDLVDLTLNVATAGTLDDELFSTAVTEASISDAVLIRNIAVTGSLNANDVAYLNTLPNTLYNIEQLDLSGAAIEDNTIAEHMFYQTLFKAITLPAGVTAIGREAFRDSRRLHTVTLSEGLQSIGSYAFAGSGLTSLNIPDAVITLGDRGVQGCASLKTVTIGNGVTIIPDCWAENSDNIEEITLGKRVTAINWRAFRGPNIKHLYSYAYLPPVWGTDVPYDGINPEAVVHTYSNSVKRYQMAYRWNNFNTIVGDLGTYPTYELTVNVSEMGTFSHALAAAMTTAGCDDLRDITKLTISGTMNQADLNYIRDNMGACLDILDLGAVTMQNNTIGDQALRGCAFRELILPATLQRFADWSVLEGCANLTTIHIPSGVKFICPNFLERATSLQTVTGGEGVVEMDNGNGMYFDNCPALQTPVILGNFFYRLPLATQGAYEVPEGVTVIARDAMWHVTGLTALTLPESVARINGNAFAGDENLKDIYYYATELPVTDWAFNDFNREACTLHVYEEMVEVFQANEPWSTFHIVGDLGPMPNTTPMADADYADLCALYNTLGGSGWHTKWMVNKNVQTASRWPGVTFDDEGYVTAIDLHENRLSGDISTLTFTGLKRLKSLNLSSNAITGDILPLAQSLPQSCTLNVERQDLGYVGELTLYEACNYTGLPSIAYYQSQSGTLAKTLIGVSGICQFYHEGTNDGHYWDSYIYADGGTHNNFKFYWPSPATVECFYPHHFTFTYTYEMGDANMDDALNVLDLQSTLNYSNGRSGGLFNHYAADTYGPDDDINVQDIVTTVNILLAQESGNQHARTFRAPSQTEMDAMVSVEDGQLVLYTTRPVAALDLQLMDIQPEQLNWDIEDSGFTAAATSQGRNTHAIVYSMQPREIAEGRTVLATFDASLTPMLSAAVLSDSKALPISVGNTMPTSIRLIENGSSLQERPLYDLQGYKVNGQLRKGMYIQNGKKVVIK